MELFLEYVSSNNIHEVEKILKNNTDIVNQIFIPERGKLYSFYDENFNHGTALHVSSAYGYKDMCDLLIKYGADINIKNNYGKNPLFTCLCGKNVEENVRLFSKNHLDTLDYLLDNEKLNILDTSYKGSNLLFEYIEHIQLERLDIEKLIEHYDYSLATEKLLDLKDVRLVFNKIINKGIDVNYKSKSDWSALLFASINNARWALEMLIASGADYNYKVGHIDIWYCLNNEKEIYSFFKPKEKDEIKIRIKNLIKKMEYPYGIL